MSTVKNKKGFSLIDLLVSISIATFIMSVVLFSYRTFENKLAVSSAVQEIAVYARTAQSSSINTKEISAGSGNFTSRYGIYFSTLTPDSYYMFADANNSGTYTGDTNCSSSTECIQKLPLKNNVKITGLCGLDSSGVQQCPPPGATGVSVVFVRPDPDAHISFTNSSGSVIPGSYTSAKIVTGLTDLLTVNTQSAISVSQSGSIYIQPDISSVPTTNNPPVITLSGPSSITVPVGSVFVDPGVTASDTEDGNISSQVVTVGSVNTLIPGTYILVYTVTDSGGFPASSVTRSVVVGSAVGIPAIVGMYDSTTGTGFPTIAGHTVTVAGMNFTPTNNTVTIQSIPPDGGSTSLDPAIVMSGLSSSTPYFGNSLQFTMPAIHSSYYATSSDSLIYFLTTVTNSNGTSAGLPALSIIIRCNTGSGICW